MTLEVSDAPVGDLTEYARISIAFEVESCYHVSGDPGRWMLTEAPVDPYIKDYDALPGESPRDWPKRFDVSRWRMIVARVDGQWAGGAVVAFDTPNCDMLEGRRDLAVLWDIRVAPEFRRRGVGAALFAAAERWARDQGCTELRVETQNVNVPASRFYARNGCLLAFVDPNAYPDLPGEIRLLWSKGLTAERVAAGR